MSKDEMILKQIVEYVKDDRYKQAVMLDGEWGSGKTFFIKNRLKLRLEKELNNKKVYYISLYGLSETKEIYKEIYTMMLEDRINRTKALEKLKEKIGHKTVDKGSKVVKKGANIVAKLIETGAGYFNFDTSKLPDITDFVDVGDAVLIFDDLERCEIEINQILGTINNLVEHNNIKVILVACEKEIGKRTVTKDMTNKYLIALNEKINWNVQKSSKDSQDKYTIKQLDERVELLFPGDVYYKKIKEKLIGLTISYEANIPEILDLLIKEQIKIDSVKEYLNENKNLIIDIFLEKKHSNIRTLLFGLIAVEKIFAVLEKIKFDPQCYIEKQKNNILKYIFECSIQIKSNSYKYPWENKTINYGTVYWDGSIYGSKTYGYKFVDDYLLYCNLNDDEITEVICQIANEKKEYELDKAEQDSLIVNKLWSWWDYEDEDIIDMLRELKNELQQKKYSPRYFKDIIIALMQMKERGFADINYEEYVLEMQEYLTCNSGALDQRHLRIISTDPSFIQDYNKVAKPLLDVIEKEEHIRKKVDISIFHNIEFWNEKLAEKCNELRTVFINDKKFFYYLEPDIIVDLLNEAKVKEINDFKDGIRSIYDFSNLSDFFKADIDNLEILISKIDEEKETKITRRMALKSLKKVLEDSLNIIKN